ncbi:methionine--tRNA ligase [Brucella intermedia]|uniref:methionine--tRNA ligase n=1 Tax=Brucella intermedia TaxID=94625 RepID=UPI00224AE365|nr:methionine--tRNA ligase [Brucella intermedia]
MHDNENGDTTQLRYITTAIPYVNAAPHIGFALEAVQTDTLARFYRQKGCCVRFQTGTDENSLKNVQAAEIAGIPVAALVERNADRFKALRESLDLSFDKFIRTSVDQRHRQGVEHLWNQCYDRGDIYKRAYSGLYCIDCEQFYKPDDLEDGKCPEHGTTPEFVEEENWFFRLSRFESALRDLYRQDAIQIVPDTRRNEVLSWIAGGLEDFSISRSATRARGWGIPVPNDPDQVIYVWFDALGNYITPLGYGDRDNEIEAWWSDASSREHVIGKGITRFHTIYWPAILLSAGLSLPTRILVHGYVTVEGRKIGKSNGNAIDPVPLAQDFGTDALRYFLLRHIRPTSDGDFSRERFRQAYESELAGQFGNLVHRVLSMIERYCGAVIPTPPTGFTESDELISAASSLPERVEAHLAAFAFDRAIEDVWAFIARANRYVTEQAPWDLAKSAAQSGDEGKASLAKLKGVLFSLSTALHVIAECINPVLPSTGKKLLAKLDSPGGNLTQLEGLQVTAGEPLFPKR